MRFSLSVLMYSYIHHFFFFNDTATTEIYTLSLHDALPISERSDARRQELLQKLHREAEQARDQRRDCDRAQRCPASAQRAHEQQPERHVGKYVGDRSEEHTSELQSLRHLVCRLLLEKKKKQ